MSFGKSVVSAIIKKYVGNDQGMLEDFLVDMSFTLIFSSLFLAYLKRQIVQEFHA